MKISLCILALLVLSLCAAGLKANDACEEVPAGQTFLIRLLQPVSSYSSKPGAPLRGILIESPRCNGVALFPEGSLVEGRLTSVHKVGLGFRHEIATLEMEFDRITPRDSAPVAMNARVLQVENARERVRNGVIHGIRSTNSPQDHLTGRIGYFTMWNPSTLWILPTYKAAFPFLPEPELYFPAGTDVLLELKEPVAATRGGMATLANATADPSFVGVEDSDVASFPARTFTREGVPTDVVNLMFIGSREQVKDAFTRAGWLASDPMNRHAVMHEMGAFALMKNYPHGPMSRQLLQGHASDLSLEKGLDSLAKRDHLRIWSVPQTSSEQTAWLGAATRDVRATFSVEKRRFVHHVETNIDDERARVVRDLTLAGCVSDVRVSPRTTLPSDLQNASGDHIQTDDGVAIVQLRDCAQPAYEPEMASGPLPSRPRSFFVRYLRTQILSARDLWRENAGYGVFEVSRATVNVIRRHRERSYESRHIPVPATISAAPDPNANLSAVSD